MNRYLLNIAYIGTKFRGIQKIKVLSEPTKTDTTTVQGCIELALKYFRPINVIQLHLSSRTDSGVHALNSTVHVDLEHYKGKEYLSDTITFKLNNFFSKNNFKIRILKTTRVSNDFHCRYNAKSRTYLYRIAVAKNHVNNKLNNCAAYIPIEDIDRCFYIQNPDLNIENIKRISKLFIGKHDFRSFMSVSSQKDIQSQPMYTIRSISDIIIRKSLPTINSYELEKALNLYDYWEFEITGRSFLYKQVRRIVGCFISFGTNVIHEKDIYEMLTIPSKNTWNNRITLAPAFGLYLCKVHYNHEDLK